MSDDLVEVGRRIRVERERLGFNQTDFAALGGVNRSSQAEYEGGKRPFSANYLIGLASGGVDVAFVTTGNRVPDSQQSERSPVMMQVFLPPRPALAQMFEAVLLVYPDLHGAELAQALARHLPSGLAQLADLDPAQPLPRAPAATAPPDPAEDRPAPQSATRR